MLLGLSMQPDFDVYQVSHRMESSAANEGLAEQLLSLTSCQACSKCGVSHDVMGQFTSGWTA